VVQPGPGGFNQIDWKELDNEEIITRSPRPASEAVVLQPDAGVYFAIVLDDVAWHLKTPREMGIAHGAYKRLWAWRFRIEAASFTIVAAPVMRVLRVLLELRTVVPWELPLLCLRFQSGTWPAPVVVG
jgi:hypothetical protein